MTTQEAKDSIRRFARAGIPFNPVSLTEFTGANLQRLRSAMQDNAWQDPRFVSDEQAQKKGWKVSPDAVGVEVLVRDQTNGGAKRVNLYNSATVLGMPVMADLLDAGEAQFNQWVDLPAPQVAQASQPELDEPDLVISAASPQLESVIEADQKPNEPQSEPPTSPGEAFVSPEPDAGTFSVFAPYFLNGLHNFEGIELAKQINQLITDKKLAKDNDSIELLLRSYPKSRSLSLEVAPAEKLRNDTLWKLNPSEPKTLIEGALARDKDGTYRPAAGGMAVLKDTGVSVTLKSRSDQAFRGAMELAKAKGWTVIELKGRPATLSKAWVEAKMMGLEVAKYQPTEQDRKLLAERLALEAQRRGQAAEPTESQEVAEIKPSEVVLDKVVQTPGADQVPTAGKLEQVASKEAPSNDEPLQAAQPAAPKVSVGDDRAASSPVSATSSQPSDKVDAPNIANPKDVDDHAFKGVVLEAHGAAPFDHRANNTMSYFATVRDSSGNSKTVWGVDLPRALKEAGADVGDTITLSPGDREPVTLKIPTEDGRFEEKVTHRVVWAASLLQKSVQAQAAPEAPVKPKKAASRKKKAGPEVAAEAPQGPTAVVEGIHIGPILKVEGSRIGQKTGRDPEKLSWHDVGSLSGPVPNVGDWAEIAYSAGRGQVKVRDRDLAKATGHER